MEASCISRHQDIFLKALLCCLIHRVLNIQNAMGKGSFYSRKTECAEHVFLKQTAQKVHDRVLSTEVTAEAKSLHSIPRSQAQDCRSPGLADFMR